MLRPYILATLLLLHALAHAGGGMWAAGRAAPVVVAPLWLAAMCGFLATSLAVFGLERLRPYAARLAVLATFASAALFGLAGPRWLVPLALAVGIAFSAALHWWRRCAHPEIHTPTMTTSEYAIVDDRPSRGRRLGAALAYATLAYTALLIVLRPSYQGWGAQPNESTAPLRDRPPGHESDYRVETGIEPTRSSERVRPLMAPIVFYVLEPVQAISVRLKARDTGARAER